MTDDRLAAIATNIAQVQATIATACEHANRNPDEITLIAVSKKKSVEAILMASSVGVQHFGENRVEEAESKIPLVNQRANQQPIWHMVGHVQTRKAKGILPLFHVLHSLDSVKLARKLSTLVTETDDTPKLTVLIQINVSGEDTKSGLQAASWQTSAAERRDLFEAVRQIASLPGINLGGLMTMAPIVEDMQQTRPVFARLAALREALADDLNLVLPDLSMGMTDDYPVAIEEGATIVRVGRAIFGERD